MNDKVADAVFHVRGRIGCAEQAFRIAFILGEEERRRAFCVEKALAEVSMGDRDDPSACILSLLTQGGASDIIPP